MAKIRKDFCPVCGKEAFRRDIKSFTTSAIEVGGRNEKCFVCKTVLWIPVNSEEEIFGLVAADEVLYALT